MGGGVDGQEVFFSAFMQAGGQRARTGADDLLVGGLVRAVDFFQDKAVLILR